MTDRPGRSRVYQNHHLDSTRWDRLEPRSDDIVISTSYKAGTTWMQTIVANLLFPHGDLPDAVTAMSPWLDNRVRPLEDVLENLAGQTHRRFIKSHLALDGQRYWPEAKFVVVGRDARDVFMSLWNHYSNHTPEFYGRMNDTAGRVGAPFPLCPDDLHEVWRSWATRGWFDWESDGYPYWSHLHHAKTWWEWRHLDNILLVHFQDLLDDREGEMRRVAEFLEIDVPEERWPHVVEEASFATMKENAEQILPEADLMWKGGAKQFIHKGTNGRWRDVLTETDLALYTEARDRTLSPECAAWLETGRSAGGP